jgi:uncharacterized protein (TIGR01777 family)
MTKKMLRIVVGGASGTLGSNLVPFLQNKGHEVTVLERKKNLSEGSIFWDPENKMLSPSQLEGFDVIINLSGYPVMCGRWTPAKMEKIRSSRVDSTRLLVDAICTLKHPPQLFISSSAIGYYGDCGDKRVTEESPLGAGFLASVCQEWEEEAKKAESSGVRVVRLRTGIVLTPKGGALATMLSIFRLGLGGKISSGNQYMSWIAIDDFLALIQFIIDTPELSGAINATSPTPVTNKTFTKTLAKVLHRPAIFPVPAWGLRLVFGKCADEALLIGSKVYPEKLLAAGFSFSYGDLSAALSHVLRRKF